MEGDGKKRGSEKEFVTRFSGKARWRDLIFAAGNQLSTTANQKFPAEISKKSLSGSSDVSCISLWIKGRYVLLS